MTEWVEIEIDWPEPTTKAPTVEGAYMAFSLGVPDEGIVGEWYLVYVVRDILGRLVVEWAVTKDEEPLISYTHWIGPLEFSDPPEPANALAVAWAQT